MPVMLAALQEPAEEPTAIVGLDRDGGSFALRAYQPTDRGALEDFYDEFEPKRGAQGLPPIGRPRVARWLDGVLPLGIHLVATRGDLLIGHAFVVPTPQAGVGEYAVFLREEERGKGVGTEIHRLTIDFARAAGLRSLWLTVEPHNRAAIRSYENAGFRFRPGTIVSPEPEMMLEL